MTTYRLFLTLSSAWAAIEKINSALKYDGTMQTWGQPIEHPYSEGALVRYRPEMLNTDALAAFDGTEEINLSEAARLDFYIGPFRGRFGKARAKLEEAQFLFDVLASHKPMPAAPLVRALFFAFLSTLYAVQETLKKVSMSRDNNLRAWWRLRKAELERKGELLQYLLFIVNRDKHNPSSYIGYSAQFYGERTLKSDIPEGTSHVQFSAEGMLAYIYPNTPRFRRIPIGTVNANYFVSLIGAPCKHLGQPVNGSDLFDASKIALEYFEQVVFDAELLEAAEVENSHS